MILRVWIKKAAHESNARVTEFESNMADREFAYKVDEAGLLSYLIDLRADYEHRVGTGRANKSYYNEYLGEVNQAINGDTRSRAEFCRSHADIVARNAVSEFETKTAFGLEMFDQYKQASSGWWKLSQRLYEKAETVE